MWTHELVQDTEVAPAAIWAVLADIDHWVDWDTSMDAISLLGPFEVGTQISMTPTGQDPIVSTIVEIVPNERYGDRTDFGGVTLDFIHVLARRDEGGTRVSHRLTISGPAVDDVAPDLGPMITSDFPEAMDGLIAAARVRSADPAVTPAGAVTSGSATSAAGG